MANPFREKGLPNGKGGCHMRKQNRNGKVKGTVLFTVVTIMMVMVVFLLSTLVITASSERRTYYTYYQKQAQFACQSALDAISERLYEYRTSDVSNTAQMNGCNSFYEWVTTQVTTPNVQVPIDIEYSYSTNNTGNGRVLNLAEDASGKTQVHCFIEKLPDASVLWDDEHARVIAQDQWKITATATVGAGRNQAEYTICNYIYEERPDNDSANPTLLNEIQVNRITGWTPTEILGTPIVVETPTGRQGSVSNAIYTMSAVTGATANNLICMGPQFTNVNTFPAGRTQYDRYDYVQTRNDMFNVGQSIMLGNSYIKTHATFTFQTPGEGAVYYGDLNGDCNDVKFISKMKPNATQYNQLGYLYVDGCFTPMKCTFGDASQPVNIYAGSIHIDGEHKLDGTNYTDIYLYDPDPTYGVSTLSASGGTKLSRFTSDNIKKTDTKDGFYGGNVICNNSSLTIGTDTIIGGDLIFTNPAGTLNVNAALSVTGNVICMGKLVGADKITAAGVYANPANNAGFTNPAKITCDTLEISNMDTANLWTYEAGFDYTNDYADKIPSGDYFYGLFPYQSRLDEIFECYMRWDLASTDSVTAAGYINTDPLIQESIAAGHQWTTIDQVSDAGTVSVPCTSPNNRENHSFIPQLTTVKSSAALGASNIPTSLDGFKAYCGISGDLPLYGGEYNTPAGTTKLPTADVTIVSHLASGSSTDSTVELKGAYIVDQSCNINLSTFPMNANVTIFVDPSTAPNNQIALQLTGQGYNNKIDIVVNNTAQYTKDIYTNPVPYYEEKTFAGREDCLIFLDNALGNANGETVRYISNNHFNITTTGAYRQMKAKEYNVVSNPFYPGGNTLAQWEALDNNEKYRYELVPNITVYGWANETYYAQNGVQFSAETLMPMSIFYSPSGDDSSKAKCTYREFHDSEPVATPSNLNANCNGVGTLCLKDYQGQNVPLSIYVGDLYRVTKTKITPKETVYDFSNDSNGKKSEQQQGGAAGKFGNDHQGAN